MSTADQQPKRRITRNHATSKDVAALAGVAQSTVSYALTGSRPVSKAARERIEAAMKQLNYHPNSSARTLRTSRTQLIGLIEQISVDSDGVGIPPYLSTIVAESRKYDYDVILNTMAEGADVLKRLAGRAVCDGFIIMDITHADPRIPVAAEIGMPTVLFGMPDDAQGLDYTYFDYAAAADIIIDAIADSGHRHVVLVGETPSSSFGWFLIYDRYVRRARERAAERGLDFKVVNPPVSGVAGVEQVASALLSNCDDRLALVTRGPLATDWVSRMLEKNGILPGKDVSLVGIVDDHMATSAKVSLTNVSPRPQTISRLAVQMLIDRINDPSLPQQIKPVHPNAISFRASSVDWE